MITGFSLIAVNIPMQPLELSSLQIVGYTCGSKRRNHCNNLQSKHLTTIKPKLPGTQIGKPRVLFSFSVLEYDFRASHYKDVYFTVQLKLKENA